MADPLVKVGNPGRRVLVHQQAVEDPPYTNCRIVDALRLLIFGGVSIPDKRRLVRRWRDATGVPEVAGGVSQGTRASEVLAAARIILPWVPFAYGPWNDSSLLNHIRDGHMTASVHVSYPALPKEQRVWSPAFQGDHVAGISNARRIAGDAWEVLWVDGLRTDGVPGEWVPWRDIRRAMKAAGLITAAGAWAMTLERGAALSTGSIVRQSFNPPAGLVIPRGTATYSFNRPSLTYHEEKPTSQKNEWTASEVVEVFHKPDRPSQPTGRLVRIDSGPREGQYVRLGAVTVTPTDPPEDCAPLIERAVKEATTPLIERLGEWEAALAAHDAVEFPDPVA